MRRTLIPATAVKRRNVTAVGRFVPFVRGWANLAYMERMRSHTTAALARPAVMPQYQFLMLGTLSG
jgi:hypothetical protein